MDTLTEYQIEALRAEAGSHGDYATVAACMVALGWEPSDMPEHVRYSVDRAVRRWVDAGDREHARRCVAGMIAARMLAEGAE